MQSQFSFRKRDLHALTTALNNPPLFKLSQRRVPDGLEALCGLFNRFAYPCRAVDTAT